jgi:ketosteroid isomerase-like protein
MSFSAQEFFKVIDTMDSLSFAHFFHADGSFTYANNPAASGRIQIAAAAQGIFDLLSGIEHKLINVWEQDGVAINEGICTYSLKSGKKVQVKFASIVALERGLIRDYRVYADPAPLLNA